jgi:phosphoribosylformylglycinamidine cyclo-ligase
MDDFTTIGQDLVAMCANDILCCGAKPLFFLDYIACGKLDPLKIKNIVDSISGACKKIDCPLIGGETAEMPGIYKDDDVDLAGFIVGIVDKDKIITNKNVKKGDVIIGISSSGAHSNGYSLIRKIVDYKKLDLNKDYKIGGLQKSLGDILLTPTILYHDSLSLLLERINIKGIANITGGGFYENIARILPGDLNAKIDSKSFDVNPIFNFLQENGNISSDEMFRVFNMGIGMVIVIDREDLNIMEDVLKEKGVAFFEIGMIKEGSGEVEIF